MFRVIFMPDEICAVVKEGTTLLQAQIEAGLFPDAPCGGRGDCGKCTVEILLENGEKETVKACCTAVFRDMTVITGGSAREHRILEGGVCQNFDFDPPVKAKIIKVKKGSVSDSRSDWNRVKAAIGEAFNIPVETIIPNMAIMPGLTSLLKRLDYTLEAVMCEGRVLTLRAPGKMYFAAVDIGTTTIVLYMLDGATGETVSTKSMLNPQTEFGADVITRANYAMENSLDALKNAVIGAVNSLIVQAVSEIGGDINDVFSVTLVGNTCMHHLFLGIDPQSLVLSPYHPVISEGLELSCSECGIAINPGGRLFFLPCIAGFVGADTVGVMLACRMDTESELTLCIDIGTNGELVLGNSSRLVACSTAAGPAFEGAKIACGMRGALGAIDHVRLSSGGLDISVIGGGKATGICGSGLMDLIAALLDAGVIDESGKILNGEDMDSQMGQSLSDRIEKVDGLNAFVVVSEKESADGRKIYIGQKDVREVQLAKGAMAAGIDLMVKTMGKKVTDVKKVLIAGAFGNYMNPKSACRIGMIPKELEDRITAVGNAAGEGAKTFALSRGEMCRAEKMAERTEFIELASDPDFQDSFIDGMMFPEAE